MKDRRLLINEAEASRVRSLFERFAKWGSATTVTRELNATGFVNRYGTRLDKGRIGRVSAAEVEAAVVDQLRVLLRSPEIVVATLRAARQLGKLN